MAGETTGVVFISHRDIHPEIRGPALSRLWRLGYVATLIQKHEPIWVVSAAGHAAGQNPQQLILGTLNPDRPAIEALVVAALGLFGLPTEISDQAKSQGILHKHDDFHYVGSCIIPSLWDEDDEDWDGLGDIVTHPSEALVEKCVQYASSQMRLGIAALPNSILNKEKSVEWLRGQGFDVDEFVYQKL